MRIALTGTDGFTGRFVEAAAHSAGLDTVRLTADLRDRAAVEDEICATEFDAIIHLAALAFVNLDDWRAFYDVNQIGTLNLLDCLARIKAGAKCILASSAQVYGPGAEGLIREDAAINPANHYAISKWAMELGARLSSDRLQIVVTRPFNYTGIGQGLEYLVPKLVDHFRRKADRIELGNLWVQRDFGDVRSVAQAYVGLATADCCPPVVNIATGKVHSIDDIVRMLTEISGHTLNIGVNPAFVRANDVPVLGGDPTLLREAVPAWRPHKLRDTLEWMYRAS